MRRAAIAMLTLAACGPRVATTTTIAAPATRVRETAATARRPDAGPKPHARGWAAVTPARRDEIRAFADDYAAYLADAKTPRRAVRGLIAAAEAAGAKPLPDRAEPTQGALYWFAGPRGDAAAFVRVGQTELLTGGLRIVVVTIDAPVLELAQRPVQPEPDADLVVFDTVPRGGPALDAWLATPLALYVYADRAGAADGPLDLAIGEADDAPVLTVPDLLPHLAGSVQANGIVDSPERMNAVAAASPAALTAALAGYGLEPDSLRVAEAALVPAGPPRFVGVDGARLAGYGHAHRALAYAALRALVAETAPETSAMVVVLGRPRDGDAESGAVAFATAALGTVARALAPEGAATDTLEERRLYARSAALVAHQLAGRADAGVALGPRVADALPRTVRRAIAAFAATGARWQLADDDAEPGSASRALAALDLAAVDIGIPVQRPDAPWSLLSTLDLYEAFAACRGWLRGAGEPCPPGGCDAAREAAPAGPAGERARGGDHRSRGAAVL